MYALDFEYDGKRLSSYGFIVCNFDGGYGINVADIGSKITFNTVSRNKGKQYSLTNTQYDECIKSSFDICKNPDIFDDLKITDDEYRKLTRWLNRREFLSFRVFDDENISRSRYYKSSFNISKIKIGEQLYGLRLDMETDKPFAYGKEQYFTWDFEDTSKKSYLYDFSDDIGYIYPHVKITCKSNGNLTLHNSFEDCSTVIKNCAVGEEIILDGNSLTISTSYNAHDICNDFNYNFFKIGNTMYDRHNEISVTLPCKLEIKYSPIIKDSP